jgi:hypothetical protein
LDSVLRKHAPAALHWKCVPYPQETHYSVQMKAFYDGFRFSHYGYATKPSEFHPMNGMIKRDKPFTIFFLNENPAARYTVGGAEPDTASRLMTRFESTVVTAPAVLRVKTFGNRPSYGSEWSGKYETGTIPALRSGSKKTKSGLRYSLYRGSRDSLPSITSLRPDQLGSVDSLFKLQKLVNDSVGIVVVEGMLDITEEGEYVFFAEGYDAVQLDVAGKTLFKVDSAATSPSQSYVASLSKGKYPMRLVVDHKAAGRGPHFIIFQSKPESEKWWEHPWKNF